MMNMGFRLTALYCLVGMYFLAWFSKCNPAPADSYQRVTADYDAFCRALLDRGVTFPSLLPYVELEQKLTLTLISLREIAALHSTSNFGNESLYGQSVSNMIQVLFKEIGHVKSYLDIAQYALAQVTPMKNQCLETTNKTTGDAKFDMSSDACQYMYAYIKVYNGCASLLSNATQIVDERKGSIVSAASHLERIIGDLKNEYPSEMERCEVLANDLWNDWMDILQFVTDILIDEPHLTFEEALLKAHSEFMQNYDKRHDSFALRDVDNNKGTMFLYASNVEFPKEFISHPYNSSTGCHPDDRRINFIYKFFNTKKSKRGISEFAAINSSITRVGMIVASVL